MWQLMIKGRVMSPPLIVQPHIFCCNSFVWSPLSSFKWSAFPWAAAKIYIFPANDVSPTVPGWFSHLMRPTHGGGRSQLVCCRWSWTRLDFSCSLRTDKPGTLVSPGGSRLRSDVFSPLLYKNRSACTFCLPTSVLDQVPVYDSETTRSDYFIKRRTNKYKSI